MGRPTTNNELKRVRGRKPRDVAEFHGELTAPDGLSDLARAYWNIYAPMLRDARVATRADSHSLALLCEVSADLELMQTQLRAAGFVSVAPSGRLTAHPLVPAVRALRRQQQSLLGAFGLLPSDRSRVTVGRKADEGDAIARKYFT